MVFSIFYLSQALLEMGEEDHGHDHADGQSGEQLLPGLAGPGYDLDYPPGEQGEHGCGYDRDQHGPDDRAHLIALEEGGREDKAYCGQDEDYGEGQWRAVVEELNQPLGQGDHGQ